LKKRYQKIYLLQQEETQKRALQPVINKVEENGSVSGSISISISVPVVKYEQISNSSVSNEKDQSSTTLIIPEGTSITAIIDDPVKPDKSAKELIEAVTKPATMNGKRQLPPEEKETDDHEEDEEATFEDFNIKILQPIEDDEDHYQDIEPEQAANPTKKLKTEFSIRNLSFISLHSLGKEKVVPVKKSRSVKSRTSSLSIKKKSIFLISSDFFIENSV